MNLLTANILQTEKVLREKNGHYWELRGKRAMFKLFHEMAKRVPAYKKFLFAQKIDPNKIRSFEDLAHVPPIDKINYLRKYPLRELCWDGEFDNGQYNISATSGSTGEPFYFPRTSEQDEQYALLAELYLRTNFSVDKHTTLYINSFPMGVWIGGIFTYAAIRKVAEKKKYPLSIINPGIHKQEVIKAIKRFQGEFDQIIIGGYGPFVKDIIDDGIVAGIDWKKISLGFIFSAEGFSEDFRNFITNKTGVHLLLGTLNHYGTVDLGTMSYETPLAIALRRTALLHPALQKSLFGVDGKLPTLTQYIPELFFFEEQNGALFCSARSGLPLFRYDLKDRGNVFTYAQAVARGSEVGVDIVTQVKKMGIPKSALWELPFVQVFERSDFSVSFYAFQIYPEVIRRALEKIKKSITGKFSMHSTFSKSAKPTLIIRIELRPNTKQDARLLKDIQTVIVNQLLKESSEYRETFKEKGATIKPSIVLLPYEDPQYFRPGTKQKWVIK